MASLPARSKTTEHCADQVLHAAFNAYELHPFILHPRSRFEADGIRSRAENCAERHRHDERPALDPVVHWHGLAAPSRDKVLMTCCMRACMHVG